MKTRSTIVCCLLAGLVVAIGPRYVRAESKHVFGVHFWDWSANVDVLSHRTGWAIESSMPSSGSPNVGGRYMPATAQGFTLLQRLDWAKDLQSMPITEADQITFANQCAVWANQIKKYCRHYVIGNEMEFVDGMTPEIYISGFKKVRGAIKAVQPEAMVIIGHWITDSGLQQVIAGLIADQNPPLGIYSFDGVGRLAASTHGQGTLNIIDAALGEGVRPEVGLYYTEWGWQIFDNQGNINNPPEVARSRILSFYDQIGQSNATRSRQVFAACWFVYPSFIWSGFSLKRSGLVEGSGENPAFEEATALGTSVNALANNPILMSNLFADVPDSGTSITVSWNTNVSAKHQLWWTPAGTAGAGNEAFVDLDSTLRTSHTITANNLAPSTSYEMLPNSTRNGYADAGGRRFLVPRRPWNSQYFQVAAPTLSMRITWHTDWPSDSKVEYGRTTSLGSSVHDPQYVTSHEPVLSGLEMGYYYYRILSSQENPDGTAPLYVRSPIRQFFVKAVAPGDYDADGDVDPDDFDLFDTCFSGPRLDPGWQMPSFECRQAFDFDSDTDIDCSDWETFVVAWTGPPPCPPAFLTCVDDCNVNDLLDTCEIQEGTSPDCDGNDVPDECDPDEDQDGVPDACDACSGTFVGATVDENGCPILVAADFDQDGDVDMEDFGHMQMCLTGPGVIQGLQACQDARLDLDEDVDQDDLQLFRDCFSGPNISPPVECAE